MNEKQNAMRQIKFRAWDEVRKEMVEPTSIEIHDDGMFEVLPCYSGSTYLLMQFTGLVDGDGKEVYEGDIIDFAGLKPIEIVWRHAGFQSKLIPYETSEPIHLSQEGFTMFAKVIGNIYQNPELLQ